MHDSDHLEYPPIPGSDGRAFAADSRDGPPPRIGFNLDDDGWNDVEAAAPSPASIHTVTRNTRSRGAGSKTWMTSALIHAFALFLLGLLLAPSDLGGTGASIVMRIFEREQPPEPSPAWQPITTQVEAAPVVDEAFVEEPVPTKSVTTKTIAAKPKPTIRPPRQASGRAPRGSDGRSGSFFGIEAEGSEFVYVLDMSGSMDGRRYSRAMGELVRSVSELRSNQKFYVMLFSDETKQMFGQDHLRPKAVRATPDNKRKLFGWLQKAYEGGGTDPREALHLSLRMNPSAVYILSDGEFNGHEKQKHKKLFGKNAEAFSIVRATSVATPIHAIAFEDPKSCRNMRNLASLTGGQYRFVKKATTAQSTQADLRQAELALRAGDLQVATQWIAEANANGATSEEVLEQRSKLASRLGDLAEQRLKAKAFAAAAETLATLVELDPNAALSHKIQEALLQRFERMNRTGQFDDLNIPLDKRLRFIVRRYPKSHLAGLLCESVLSDMVVEVREALEDLDTVRALEAFDVASKRIPKFLISQGGADFVSAYAQTIYDQADEVGHRRNYVVPLRFLGTLGTQFTGTQLAEIAEEETHRLATKLLAMSSDANRAHDRKASRNLMRQLNSGLTGERSVSELRRKLAADNRRALADFRTAMTVDRRGDRATAIAKCESIVDRYPHSDGAGRAFQWLKSVRNPAPRSGDNLQQQWNDLLHEDVLPLSRMGKSE